ncbi:MAG TPA: SbcC/MukB-like Walker B domain-containing protein [Marinobacter sp.]|uniref:ATP-binding protein n=1 Tax=Marinobacter sp. TaxID=50741 RepID=UPI002D7FD50A|nr:SbcC/MukB-like Walker B domain-containing protein [Marinobacter sp.]HET8801881.1 SbcC/MukB-like Walker B domain-containing protein [Marinobacter sp.]
MSLPQNDLFAAEVIPPTAYILTHLDLYNWGPFGGRHCAEIDPRGTAIIGPTGSGKTTLVDALMTLLTHQPRYNLASTGGHESDRDLISYIRGVSGAGNNSGDNSHIARPGKTVTAVSARLSNGNKALRIGVLFWIDGSSSAAIDLKRLWLFSEDGDQSLDDWLAIHHEGGARELKQYARDTSGLQANDSKKAYLAQVRRFFEVGENAFTLLNRAAGLKQLNSIDEIFRELVLDDHSAFDRAGEVASEFDNLAAIHNELEAARKQRQSLLPIAETWHKHQTTRAELDQHQTLKDILPVWYADAGYRLWTDRIQDLDVRLGESQNAIASLQSMVTGLNSRATTLKDIYLEAGGASIEQLREQIGQQQRWVNERARHAGDYQALTRKLALDDTLSPQALAANQNQGEARLQDLLSLEKARDQAVLDLRIRHGKLAETLTELTQEIDRIKARPGSNIDGRYQEFRSELAQALNLDEASLPFVAELVQVKTEEEAWRGAIERAIGGHRLRLLVPSAAMQSALDRVNGRDNRLHVRLLEASPAQAPARFMDDGFTRKLNVKDHPHREALKHLLAGIDRHCVDSPEALRQTSHGMTRQGLMSGKKGYFEKQDNQRLDKGWMTGFNNRDRLAALTEELTETRQEADSIQQDLEKSRADLQTTRDQITLYNLLADIDFSDIDLPSAQSELDELQTRLETLTAPDSNVEKARREYEAVNEELGQVQQKLADERTSHALLDDRRRQATERCSDLLERIGDGLTDAQQSLADNHFKPPKAEQCDRLELLERTQRDELERLIGKLSKQIQGFELNLTQMMGNARTIDTGALAETGSEIRDIPEYLERLRVLEEEALPQKLERFLNYLNQSSDQGVTQLLAHIQNQVAIIEERIADLNATLRRVDFQPGRYLRLEPRRVTHESLRTLERAQRQLRADALKDDQGESHFKALQNMVGLLRDAADNKRTVGARALLDPRYRLQFEVSVLDRESEAVIETRTGSQGGSGGEKEIIASYILTASLSYALCPDGATQPLFGTIVLDEAFSKSSHAVAGRIISALNEFGLHPLFVTPNKEMRLLRAHTRSAILVHRKDLHATLTSLSWEELEAHAEKMTRKPHEIPG